MRLILASPGIETKERRIVEYELGRALPGIQRRMGIRPKQNIPPLRARLTCEGTPERPLYHLTLSIQLPDHPVIVQKSGNDLRPLISTAEAAVNKEVKRCIARIRKEHLARRRTATKASFREFASSVMGAPAPPPKGASEENPLFARLRPLLSPLYNYAREQLRTAQLAGEVPANYLTPDDLVDSAIVSMAERNGVSMTDAEKLERRLYQEIDRILSEEIGHRTTSEISIDSPVSSPEGAWGADSPEREESEYYQPFQSLRMEDVLIDEHAVDPDHHLSEVEEHRLILKNLGNFHAKARSAFFLNRVEGFDLYEIAMIQNRDEAAVMKDIEECVKTLREGWERIHKEAPAGAGKG